MSEQTNVVTDKPTSEQIKEPSKLARRLKTTGKWVGMSALVFGLGAAGFLGMKYYTENKQ